MVVVEKLLRVLCVAAVAKLLKEFRCENVPEVFVRAVPVVADVVAPPLRLTWEMLR